MRNSVSQALANFTIETRFGDLPDRVIHETKRIILDSIACGLAGKACNRGRYALELSKRLGGPQESSIIGTSDKVSSSYAAFTNGELINALDYDALEIPPGHTPPYVVPPALAIAEYVGMSGEGFITATAIGHEIAARIDRGLTPRMGLVEADTEWQQSRQATNTYLASGQAHFIFGGTAAAARLLKLAQEKITHALGIAGHFCPIPTNRKFQAFMPSAMTKYGSTGWVSIASVTAALLAEIGYLGDTSIFETEYGFWRMYSYGKWEPEKVTEQMGKTWFHTAMGYKPYPCHRAMHGPLDCLTGILEENNIQPEEIEQIHAFGNPALFSSHYKAEVSNHVAAQFNPLFIFSCAAHRVPVGDWQTTDIMRNPDILRFTRKISLEALPDLKERMKTDPKSRWGGRIELVANGKTYKKDRMFARGTAFTEVELSDEDLAGKFEQSASGILGPEQISRAIQYLLELEMVGDIRELMKQVTLNHK